MNKIKDKLERESRIQEKHVINGFLLDTMPSKESPLLEERMNHTTFDTMLCSKEDLKDSQLSKSLQQKFNINKN